MKENIFSTPEEFEVGNDIMYTYEVREFTSKYPDCYMSALLY